MTLNWINTGVKTASATFSVAVLLCFAPVSAQTSNPWSPYPAGQAQPTPAPAPAPKPKYYVEPTVAAPAEQAAPAGPRRCAPPDLDRQLSAQPQRPPYALPFGYQNGYPGAPVTPYANPPAYLNPPQGGYAQGYPMMGAPPNYGGYGPPMGNTGWGGMPGNNFSPYGFW